MAFGFPHLWAMCGESPPSPGITLAGLKRDNPPQSTNSETIQPLTDFDVFGNVTQSGTTFTLSDETNAGIQKSFSLPIGAQTLRFQYQFVTPGDGDYLVVYFGDNPPLYIGSDVALAETAPLTANVPISGYANQSGTLVIELVSRGAENAVVQLDQIDLTISDDPDSDGLTTEQESVLGTNPLLTDTDSDGLSDGDEVNIYHTNSLIADTDGDWISDGDEIAAGSDPNNAASLPVSPTPFSAVSRKVHGAAGTFDINLPPNSNAGIECRSGGANNDYQVLFSFPAAITLSGATVAPGTGKSASVQGVPIVSADGTEVTINLTGVTNAQTMNVQLNNVYDGANTGNVVVRMGVLLGDTSGNGSVNASDVSQTKARSGIAIDATNFRSDTNANGFINGTDVSQVKSNSGHAVP